MAIIVATLAIASAENLFAMIRTQVKSSSARNETNKYGNPPIHAATAN